MRGATPSLPHRIDVVVHFNSHAPCGARHLPWCMCMSDTEISTHTPHAGRDICGAQTTPSWQISTHTPHAGRDVFIIMLRCSRNISTHTPHAGRDSTRRRTVGSLHYFNSHAPCGARRAVLPPPSIALTFQLTRPMRGATPSVIGFSPYVCISTHTPHAGRDV